MHYSIQEGPKKYIKSIKAVIRPTKCIDLRAIIKRSSVTTYVSSYGMEHSTITPHSTELLDLPNQALVLIVFNLLFVVVECMVSTYESFVCLPSELVARLSSKCFCDWLLFHDLMQCTDI